jgi:hypothetical protein
MGDGTSARPCCFASPLLCWFAAIGALATTGCGAADSVACPKPVNVCETCTLTSAALVVDLSGLDLTKVQQLKADYGVEPPYPSDATAEMMASREHLRTSESGSRTRSFFHLEDCRLIRRSSRLSPLTSARRMTWISHSWMRAVRRLIHRKNRASTRSRTPIRTRLAASERAPRSSTSCNLIAYRAKHDGKETLLKRTTPATAGCTA